MKTPNREMPTPKPMTMNSSLTESVDHQQPVFSALSPRVNHRNQNPNTTNPTTLDRLLHDYEHDFGNIFNTAESLLATSGIPLMSLRMTNSNQTSLIGARQSNIEFDPSRSQVELQLNSSETTGAGAVAADEVSMILERYSDRLAAMVAEKMLASQTSSKQL
jgi:hypothetical protein